MQRTIPSREQHDLDFRRLRYCRYADDFVLGFIGSKKEALDIQEKVTQFLRNELKLDIAPEKSGIKHASDGIKFLSYSVKIANTDKLLKTIITGRPTIIRSMKERLILRVPEEELSEFCSKKRYGSWETMKSTHRAELLHNSDAEIVLQFNSEMRGLANYYALAKDMKTKLGKLVYIGESSLLKTLASKHKRSVASVAKYLDRGSYKSVKFKVKGKEKEDIIFQLKQMKKVKKSIYHNVDDLPHKFTASRTELVARLNAEICEYCGKTEGNFQVHHIRKMADIKGGIQQWEIHMIARHRKTMVLCIECHHLLHQGKLPDNRYLMNNKNGERIALKGA